MRNHLKPKLVRVIDKRGDELLHRTQETINGDRAAIKADQDWQAVYRPDAVDIPEESGVDPGTPMMGRALLVIGTELVLSVVIILAIWLLK